VASRAALSGRFVGRKDELDLLRAAFARAAGGHGSTVLLSGDAGIGKTRLIGEWRIWLQQRQAIVGLGECLDYARAPYAPFVDALRDALTQAPDALRDALAVRRILSTLIPELGGGSGPRAAEVSKRQLFDAFAEAFRIIATASTAIIAIEDLHWADPDSLDLLLHLSRIAPHERIMLVATFRDDEVDRGKLASLRARLQRRPNVDAVRLSPLERTEMRMLAREMLGKHPPTGREAIERSITLAEGNPFYAEELLRHALEGQGADMPLTLRGVILERLRSLSADQRTALVYAAVIGRRFEPELLAAALSRPIEAIIDALRAARDNQLIIEEPGQPVSYRFRHALVQEILYRELLVPEAQAVHLKIARALESDGGATRRRAMELARHYWEARDLDKTMQYADLAGDAATQTLAHAQAATHYERAIEAAPTLSQSDRSRLYEKLAFALLDAGSIERSLRAFSLALEGLSGTTRLEDMANLHLGMSRAERLLGDRRAALTHADIAIASLASLPQSSIRYRALVFRANLAANADDLPGLLATLSEAETFSGEPDLGRLSRVHALRAHACMIQGDFERARQECETAIAVAQEAGDLVALAVNFNEAALIYEEEGDLDSAINVSERAVRIARERLLTHPEVVANGNRALYLLMLGDVTAARAAIDLVLAAPSLDDQPLLAGVAMGVGILVGVRQGDAAFVAGLFDEVVLDQIFAFGGSYSVISGMARAEVFFADGRLGDAQRAFHEALAAVRTPTNDLALFLWPARFARAEDLARLRESLAPWAARQPTARGRGYLSLLDAQAARGRGDVSAAKQHAADAATALADIGYLLFKGFSLELGGRTREAVETYRRSGALGDVARLDRELAPRGRRDRHAVDLSKREREVAQLISSGKSNKAIASALGISERTVENHVTSIFKKFGVASRTELVARMTASLGFLERKK